MVQTTVRTYRDLDLNFTRHPVTKDIVTLTGDKAIIASVKNLVLTSYYERLFHPEIGSSVKQFLFENATPLTAQYIKKSIETVINNFEPRVSLMNVVVQLDEDHNRFQAIIKFFILNNTSPITVSVFLKRIR